MLREARSVGRYSDKRHHLADMNIPPHLLCNQMGHGKIETTRKYYIAVSEDGIAELKRGIAVNRKVQHSINSKHRMLGLVSAFWSTHSTKRL